MTDDKSKLYAVLTGDVVASSKIHDETGESAAAVLQRVFPESISDYASDVHGEVDVFRGDSWQVLLENPVNSLRIALLFRAGLKSEGIDTRISIGIGTVDHVPEDRVSSGAGEAFTRSGEGLDRLNRRTKKAHPNRMHVSLSVDETTGEMLGAIVRLIDSIATGWSTKQALAVRGALLGLTQEEIASSWPGASVSRQAVAGFLHRSNWPAVSSAIEAVEGSINKLIE